MYEAVMFFKEGHHRCEAEHATDALTQADLLVQEENDAVPRVIMKSEDELNEAYNIVPSGFRHGNMAVDLTFLAPQVLYVVYNRETGRPVGTLRLMK